MNDEEQRRNPDDLLKAIQQSEGERTKGRLKIFLGMAAGVGKTYAMLKAAQNLVRQDVDLLVGCIHTHGRQETAELLKGLRIIPEKSIEYKNIILKEVDIDEILRIKPQLILIDELAHTNAPGSRHPKRWQDVEEILDHGIDVYTTMNVQHIESVKDIVEEISGIKIQETVPDSVIEKAAYIELIDLTPEELLVRLKEGKVYLGDKSEIAAKHFFQTDTLTALREILLRCAAEKIEHDLQHMASSVERSDRWRPREKLLVAVNESEYAKKLIRTTRRLASQLGAPWIAMYVDEGKGLSEAENEMLTKNLALARDLGAEVISTTDPSVAEGLKHVAHQRGVTQIIVGRKPKSWWHGLFKSDPLFDKLIKECSDIDIHIIGQEGLLTRKGNKLVARSYKKEINAYFKIMLYVVLTSIVCFFGASYVGISYTGYRAVRSVFFVCILGFSFFFRKGPLILASFLYALIWEFFFVPPIFHFYVRINEDTASAILYFFTATMVSILIDNTRKDREIMAKREETTRSLYEIVRKIAMSEDGEDATKSIKEKLGRIFEGTFEILKKEVEGGINIEDSIPLLEDEKERNAALWAFDNGKEAGWSTDTLPSSKNLYIPLKEQDDVVGLLIYRTGGEKNLTLDQKGFLYTVCGQLSNYLERRLSQIKAKKTEQVEQVMQIHTSILNRISLVFQKPLLISQQAIKKLREIEGGHKEPLILSEIERIDVSLEQLMEVLANISAMVKLSDEMISLNRKWHSVNKLIDACCQNLQKVISSHRLEVILPEIIPKIFVDFSMIEILLLNLITNAAYYSPLNSKIEIKVEENSTYLIISITDEGKGIPEEHLETIFEKFYSLPDDEFRGLGIGLSLAKAIAEVHQGRIKAENCPQKGTKFSLFLPMSPRIY